MGLCHKTCGLGERLLINNRIPQSIIWSLGWSADDVQMVSIDDGVEHGVEFICKLANS